MLPNHQPDIRFQGDGLARGLHQAESRVNCLTRLVAAENWSINNGQLDERYKARSRVWIAQAQAARREAQQNVVAYRNLIAERDMQSRVLEVS